MVGLGAGPSHRHRPVLHLLTDADREVIVALVDHLERINRPRE